MRKILIGSGNTISTVYIGHSLKEVVPPAKGKRVILTDKNVSAIYGSDFPQGDVIVVKPGETSKTLAKAEEVIREMLEMGIDRNGFILGIGGGVVCDITGLIGSIYMRGIKFGFVSTTLLSQADASIGGKNGVNIDDKKNIIGTFNHPEFVICDTSMLKTLPEVEFRSGLGEVIKYAIIGDPRLFDILKKEHNRILDRDEVILEEVVYSAIEIKRKVVEADFRESGIRKTLNFGHTLGHALELHGGFRHGVAVATGMAFATELSVNLKIASAGVRKEIDQLLALYGLSPCISKIEKDSLGLIGNDKKRSGDLIDFVVIEDIGKASVRSIPITEILSHAEKWRPIQ